METARQILIICNIVAIFIVLGIMVYMARNTIKMNKNEKIIKNNIKQMKL